MTVNITDAEGAISDLTERVERATNALRMQGAELDAVNDEFSRFKEQVRAIARRLCYEQSWCSDGERNYLRELGLTPLPRAVSGTVTIKLTIPHYDVADQGSPLDPDIQCNAADDIVDLWRANQMSRIAGCEWEHTYELTAVSE